MVKQQPSNTTDQQIERTPDGDLQGLLTESLWLMEGWASENNNSMVFECGSWNFSTKNSKTCFFFRIKNQTDQTDFIFSWLFLFIPAQISNFLAGNSPSPTLMALPSLCLGIANNYYYFKAHLNNGCKSHNIYYQN